MKPTSLANITYDDALGFLQLRKEAIAAGEVTPLSAEKLASAYPLRDLGNSLMDRLAVAEKHAQDAPAPAPPPGGYQPGSSVPGIGYPGPPAPAPASAPAKPWFGSAGTLDPSLQAGILGGGLGALGGLGKSWLSDDEDEQDNWVQNMLMGGAGGAALGGGLGLMTNPASRKKVTDWFEQTTDTAETPPMTEEQRDQKVVDGILNNPNAAEGSANEADLIERATSVLPEATNVAGVGGGLIGGTKLWNWLNKPMPGRNVAEGLLENTAILSGKNSGLDELRRQLQAYGYTGLDNVAVDSSKGPVIGEVLGEIRSDPAKKKEFIKAIEGIGLKPRMFRSGVVNQGLATQMTDAARTANSLGPAGEIGEHISPMRRKALRYLPKKRLAVATGLVAGAQQAYQRLYQPWMQSILDNRRKAKTQLEMLNRERRAAQQAAQQAADQAALGGK